jgi:GH15 family glucan-1,4-alpha-glucosidase
VRNWDYRYTWLRDSAFTVGALESPGYRDEARDDLHFLHDLQLRSGKDLRVLYSIVGHSGSQLAEQTLDHLEGYRGSRPVRIGNGAAEHASSTCMVSCWMPPTAMSCGTAFARTTARTRPTAICVR